jgi:integrase/recombinase XerD
VTAASVAWYRHLRVHFLRRGAHRLRHSLATEMLRAGASLPEVGQVLRHRSMLSTSIYAKVDQNALRPLARPWPGSAA